MEAPSSFTDATIVFGDLENPSITTLGLSRAFVIVERPHEKAITQVEKGGEGGRAGEVYGTRISGSLSLISSANAIIRRRRYPWIATTSHHKLSTKVNHHSRNHRLDIDIDTLTTFSSYPRFQPQPAAPEYTGMTFLAHIGSQNSFLASAESADAVFTSQWKSLPPTNIPTFASVPEYTFCLPLLNSTRYGQPFRHHIHFAAAFRA
uniref:Uncharacterized protein n=1 Tax=Moniliophthora roreri TaxID=221103 RepID=A0A0W0G8D5_MONRR